MSLSTREFSANKLALTKIYEEIPAGYHSSQLQTEKTEQIYGPLKLPSDLADRPRLFGCFVSSIDGSIAFSDNPSSTLLARQNKFDPAGAEADFWLLNFLRANCDGVILGPKTLQAEPKLTAHLHDQDLEQARCKLLEKNRIPLNIVISRSGQSIPYDHLLFSQPEVPVVIATSPQGGDYAEQNLEQASERIDLGKTAIDDLLTKISQALQEDKVILLTAGCGKELDDLLLFNFLKQYNIDRILVEAPTYTHYLLQQGLVDELFLNQAGVYSGSMKHLNTNPEAAFSSANPPRAKMITIHTHSAHFFYYRYRFIYEEV